MWATLRRLGTQRLAFGAFRLTAIVFPGPLPPSEVSGWNHAGFLNRCAFRKPIKQISANDPSRTSGVGSGTAVVAVNVSVKL